MGLFAEPPPPRPGLVPRAGRHAAAHSLSTVTLLARVDGSTYVLDGQLKKWTGPFRSVTTPILTQGSTKPEIVLGVAARVCVPPAARTLK